MRLAALAPEFAADSRVATFVELAEERLSPGAWGAVYDTAVAYLAAHLLTRAKATAAASAAVAESPGTVTARAAGDVSESYGTGAATVGSDADADLRTTRYGLAFLSLRSTRAAARVRLARP